MKYVTILPVVLAMILAACATPPTEEMNKAQDAVTQAENDANAVTFAPNTLVRARDSLTKMQEEANSKRYDAAKNFAADAITNAEKAIADGKTGAARAREEAENLLNSLAGPLAETTSALDAAQKVNNIDLDFASLLRDLDTAKSNYDEARQSLQANRYQDAIDKGQNVRSILASINARLTDATQATFRKQ